jgi:hypothetical protein
MGSSTPVPVEAATSTHGYGLRNLEHGITAVEAALLTNADDHRFVGLWFVSTQDRSANRPDVCGEGPLIAQDREGDEEGSLQVGELKRRRRGDEAHRHGLLHQSPHLIQRSHLFLGEICRLIAARDGRRLGFERSAAAVVALRAGHYRNHSGAEPGLPTRRRRVLQCEGCDRIFERAQGTVHFAHPGRVRHRVSTDWPT